METTLFTELTDYEQESLSGGQLYVPLVYPYSSCKSGGSYFNSSSGGGMSYSYGEGFCTT